MEILVLGLIVFFVPHLFTSARQTREILITKFGEKAYKGIYSLVSLLGLALIVWGKAKAPGDLLWSPPLAGRSLTLAFMPLAFIAIAASHMPTNIKRFTAHPMLWGITLWAVLHLLSNGERASVLLFGSFALYSLYAMYALTRRGSVPRGAPVPVMKDVVVVAAGLVVSAVLFAAHGWLFGVPLLH